MADIANDGRQSVLVLPEWLTIQSTTSLGLEQTIYQTQSTKEIAGLIPMFNDGNTGADGFDYHAKL